jgi:hypothetical protein
MAETTAIEVRGCAMRTVLLMLAALALLAAFACDDNGGETRATPTTGTAATDTPGVEATPTAPASSTLKPPDSEFPAAGICAEPGISQVVTITFREDVPDPRCAKVNVPQRLRIVNQREQAARIVFGPYDVTIEPGAEQLFDAPVGTYLAPGVHTLGSPDIEGYAADVWVLDVATP